MDWLLADVLMISSPRDGLGRPSGVVSGGFSSHFLCRTDGVQRAAEGFLQVGGLLQSALGRGRRTTEGFRAVLEERIGGSHWRIATFVGCPSQWRVGPLDARHVWDVA